jgi:hypothetical protein
MFKECMVEFKKIDGDHEMRLVWHGWEKTTVDQDGTQGWEGTALCLQAFKL